MADKRRARASFRLLPDGLTATCKLGHIQRVGQRARHANFLASSQAVVILAQARLSTSHGLFRCVAPH